MKKITIIRKNLAGKILDTVEGYQHSEFLTVGKTVNRTRWQIDHLPTHAAIMHYRTRALAVQAADAFERECKDLSIADHSEVVDPSNFHNLDRVRSYMQWLSHDLGDLTYDEWLALPEEERYRRQR